MQTGAGGDLGQEQALSLQESGSRGGPGNIARACAVQSSLPCAISLGRGSWALGNSSGAVTASACSLLDRAMMLAAAVDQPVAGHFHQEGAKVRPVGEPPARIAETRQHVGPDRLDDIHRSRAWCAAARSTGAARPSASRARTPGKLAPRPTCRLCSAARSAHPGGRQS